MIKKRQINLILQGGGIKGLAYIGALRCFEENNYTIKNIAGTSVGAIIGSLIIAGYDSYDLENIINSLSENILFTRNTLENKIKNKGIYSMKSLEYLLEKLLNEKNIRCFNDIKVGKYYKAIFIATSLKYKRIFVLPYDLKLINIDPDSFSVAKAAIMSASIPIFYEPYKVNNNYFIDGGISDNFPIWCFKEAVALKLGNESEGLLKIKQKMFGRIYNNTQINEININTKGYKATDFKKGLANKYDLYNRGYCSVYNWFKEKK